MVYLDIHEDLFYTAPIDGILWSGHHVPIVDMFAIILQLIKPYIDLTPYLPPQLEPDGNLAFYRGKNATAAKSFYVVNNGRPNREKYTHIEKLNGKETLPNWWWPDIAPSPAAQDMGIKGILLKGDT